MVVVFLFHRDLRLTDNLALMQLKEPAFVPLFCFNPKQVDRAKSKYYNEFAIQFMCESLKSLKAALGGSLNMMYGQETDCIADILKIHQVEKIYQNQDITPFAKERTAQLERFCKKHNIKLVNVVGDYTLYTSFDFITKPVKLFSKFKSLVEPMVVARPLKPKRSSVAATPILLPLRLQYVMKYKVKPSAVLVGGREHALKRLASSTSVDYDKVRNQIWNDESTTRLSPYLKFGSISIREFYWAVVDRFGPAHGLVNELVWRSYFDYICITFPTLLQNQTSAEPNMSLSSTFHHHEWNNDKDEFDKWAKGKTGVPLVDAAMNELHTTGYMHNRCRMVAAMYAVRDMNLDWRKCERHFAQYLVDYAPAQNVGNWSWILSYRFKFSPWAQQKRFDKEGKYIAKWLPGSLHKKQIS